MPSHRSAFGSGRRVRTIIVGLLAGVAATSFVWAAGTPAILPQPVFDPFTFGAKGDGTANDRVALQKALDACAGTGGSVWLHDGQFLSGQITLHSDMTLYIAPSAVLLGVQSTSDADYPRRTAATENHMNQTCQRRLVWGEGLKNVTITGGGTIDGQGDFSAWRNGREKVAEKERPSLLEIAESTNVTVSGVRLVRSAMWTQVYLECTQVLLRDLTVNTGNIPGTRDGMDICDCHNIRVERCAITSQDDGICLKSGSALGCADIVVRDCVIEKFGNSAGNGVKFGTASQGGLHHALFEHVTVCNSRNSAFTLEAVDGATIREVEFRDCRAARVGQVLSLLLGPRHGAIGTIDGVIFRRISGEDLVSPIACLVSGAPDHPIRHVTFDSITVTFPGGVDAIPPSPSEYRGEYPEGTHFGALPGYAFYLRHADGIAFANCIVGTTRRDARPWLGSDDASNVTVRDVRDQGQWVSKASASSPAAVKPPADRSRGPE